MTRYLVHVDDDFIHAESERDARAEMIQALVEDPSLIDVKIGAQEDDPE